MTEAKRLRSRAQHLRDQLVEEQHRLDAQLASEGAVDPIRHVTGRSSLEQAIESADEMIRSIDRILHDETPAPIVTTVRGFSRLRIPA